MSRAAIYARLSLADEKSTSTKRQEKECRDYAAALGLEVVKVYVDEGISGYKDVERPAFDEGIEALFRGEFDTLIVWKLDRLSRRGMGHVGTLLDRLDGSGRRILSKSEGIDTSQGHGRLLVGMLAEMARSESANTSMRLKAQRKESRDTGRISSGSPPWGMMRLEDGTIAPDPATGPIAREIVERYLKGEPKLSLVRWLNQNGHSTARGGLWTFGALGRWLTFPTLAGFVSVNPEGKRYPEPYRSAETGEIVMCGTGLISEAEYYAIRGTLRGPHKHKSGRKSSAQLSGLMKCSECGSTLYGSGPKYYCSGKNKGICTATNTIDREQTEELVGNLVVSRICALEMGSEIHLRVEDAWRGDGSDAPAAVEAEAFAESRLVELENRMSALLEDRYSKGAFDGQLELFDKLRDDLQGQIDKQRQKVGGTSGSGKREATMDLSDSEIVREAWESASPEDKNRVIKIVLESAVLKLPQPGKRLYDETRLEFHWRAA